LYVVSDPLAIQLYANTAKKCIKHCLVGNEAKIGLPRIGVPCRTVGMLAVYNAVKLGATDVILCGIDGWKEDEMDYKRGNHTWSRCGSNENAARWLEFFSKSIKISFIAPGPLWNLCKDYCNLYK